MTEQVSEAAAAKQRREAQLTAMLNEVDQQLQSVEDETRSATRYQYRRLRCPVAVRQPQSAGHSVYSMTTRNLSATGVALWHAGFVHTGSHVVVLLQSREGEPARVPGRVVRCRHLCGSLHELGVQFHESIEPADFLPSPPPKHGMIAHDESLDVSQFNIELGQLCDEIVAAHDRAGVFELVQSQTFDFLLLDMASPDIDGPAFVKELRDSGYRRVIFGLLPEAKKDQCEASLLAGCERVLICPADGSTLRQAYEDMSLTPMRSRYWHDPGIAPMLNLFLGPLASMARDLELAWLREDMDKLSVTARLLLEQGGSFGYDEISQAAFQLMEALRRQPMQPGDVHRALRALQSFCFAARWGTSTEAWATPKENVTAPQPARLANPE